MRASCSCWCLLIMAAAAPGCSKTAADPVAAAATQAKDVRKEHLQLLARNGQLVHSREIDHALDQMPDASDEQKWAILAGTLDLGSDFDWKNGVEITRIIAGHPGALGPEFLHKLGHLCAIVQQAYPRKSVHQNVDATLEAVIAAGDNWSRLGERGGSSAIETVARIGLNPKEALGALAAKVREGTTSEGLFDAAIAIKKQRNPDPPETPQSFLRYCLEGHKRTADGPQIWEALRKVPDGTDEEKAMVCVNILEASPTIDTANLTHIAGILLRPRWRSSTSDLTILAALAGAANEAFPGAEAFVLSEIARKACLKEGPRAADVYTVDKIKSLARTAALASFHLDGRQ